MKKKSKMKNNKQKQKQKQKQSIVVNIDNSRKTVARPRKSTAMQQKQPSIIPQPIYVPQITYAPPERTSFREEPTKPPVFNPAPPSYNPPQLVPQQVQPTQLTTDQIRQARMKMLLNQEIENPPSSSSSIASNAGFAHAPNRFDHNNSSSSISSKSVFGNDNPPTTTSLSSSSQNYFQTSDILNSNERELGGNAGIEEEQMVFPSALEKEIASVHSSKPFTYDDAFENNEDTIPFPNEINSNKEPPAPVQQTSNNRAPNPSTTTCRAIIQSGARKGKVCGRKTIPNSLFCGHHKQTDIRMIRPMEKYLK